MLDKSSPETVFGISLEQAAGIHQRLQHSLEEGDGLLFYPSAKYSWEKEAFAAHANASGADLLPNKV